MGNFLASTTSSVLQKALDGFQLRHQAISNNIANVDTPHYKRQDVDFKSQLEASLNNRQTSLSRTNNRHISNFKSLENFNPQFKLDNNGNTFLRNDKNNVDIDREMAALSKNTLEYQAVSDLLSRNLQRVSDSINRST